jgi:hypothetical protein
MRSWTSPLPGTIAPPHPPSCSAVRMRVLIRRGTSACGSPREQLQQRRPTSRLRTSHGTALRARSSTAACGPTTLHSLRWPSRCGSRHHEVSPRLSCCCFPWERASSHPRLNSIRTGPGLPPIVDLVALGTGTDDAHRVVERTLNEKGSKRYWWLKVENPVVGGAMNDRTPTRVSTLAVSARRLIEASDRELDHMLTQLL